MAWSPYGSRSRRVRIATPRSMTRAAQCGEARTSRKAPPATSGRSSAPTNFFYMLGTFFGRPGNEMNPQTETVGTATTQSTGRKAAISFDPNGGQPFPGNQNLVMELEAAVPNAPRPQAVPPIIQSNSEQLATAV